jgi:hypothetical protein
MRAGPKATAVATNPAAVKRVVGVILIVTPLPGIRSMRKTQTASSIAHGGRADDIDHWRGLRGLASSQRALTLDGRGSDGRYAQ